MTFGLGFTQPLTADLPLEGSVGGRVLGATHNLSARGKLLDTVTGSDVDFSNMVNDLDKLKADVWKSIAGLVPNIGSDTDHDIDISPGACADSENEVSMYLGSTLTKQIDADWAEGSAAGGLASGARSVADTPDADTWYHVFTILKIDVEAAIYTIDGGFDTSLTATNLLADATNYTQYRLIGSVFVDGSNNITGYFATEIAGGGVHYAWDAFVEDENTGSPGTTIVDLTLTVPTGYQVLAKILATLGNTSDAGVRITEKTQDNATPAFDNSALFVNAGATYGNVTEEWMTDTAALINYRASTATLSGLTINTVGWTDPRR